MSKHFEKLCEYLDMYLYDPQEKDALDHVREEARRMNVELEALTNYKITKREHSEDVLEAALNSASWNEQSRERILANEVLALREDFNRLVNFNEQLKEELRANHEERDRLNGNHSTDEKLTQLLEETLDQHDNGHSPCNCLEIKTTLLEIKVQNTLLEVAKATKLDESLYECEECSAKPGSPTLCLRCAKARAVAGVKWKGIRPKQ